MQTTLVTRGGKEIRYSPKVGGFRQWDAVPCLRCGVCCTRWQPQIDAREAAAIARGLGVSVAGFYRDYLEDDSRKRGLHLLRRSEERCIFLRNSQGHASCAIHSFRPEACRQWVPSLARPECREGLRGKEAADRLLLPREMYASEDGLNAFCQSLEEIIK
jgi:Fe-S-cluster containining protein